MTSFEIVLVCFIFCVNFIEMTNSLNCSKDNQLGTCAKLSCPSERNGKICQKRRCVKNDDSGALNIAAISSIVVVSFIVLFAIILVGAIMWIRSRRLGGDDADRKSSVRSTVNPYTFRSYPSSTTTGLNNPSQNPRPPLPFCDDEYENTYEYETVDFLGLKPQMTNTTSDSVEETENGYLVPSALTKPNFPPPRTWEPAN